MSHELNASVRGPDAYAIAARAVASMQAHKVWPTPLNYELWLHFTADPTGALGREIARIVDTGETFTDILAEDLAAQHLPRLRFNEEMRDAGDQLSRQLESVARAIEVAQESNQSYGRTLAGAERELKAEAAPEALQRLVEHLAFSTLRVQKENGALERRLAQSTQEVRRLREHLEQVRREAMTDALTLLVNRRAFDEALERACTEAEEAGTPLSLALIDIDHFKRFNDTWGHQTGDQVIRYVGSIIGRVGAQPRVAARYGGEEFAILFPSESGAPVSHALEAIRVEISSRMLKRRSTNEDLGAVTVSAGFALRRPGEAPAAFVERTDAALYVSKRTGRNRTSDADDDAPSSAAA